MHARGQTDYETYRNILKFIKIGCHSFPQVCCTRKNVGTLCLRFLHLNFPYLPIQSMTNYRIIFIPALTTFTKWLNPYYTTMQKAQKLDQRIINLPLKLKDSQCIFYAMSENNEQLHSTPTQFDLNLIYQLVIIKLHFTHVRSNPLASVSPNRSVMHLQKNPQYQQRSLSELFPPNATKIHHPSPPFLSKFHSAEAQICHPQT